MTDHVPLARPFLRSGVEGFTAACLCGWEGGDWIGRAEARTSARMAAERHVCKEEDYDLALARKRAAAGLPRFRLAAGEREAS